MIILDSTYKLQFVLDTTPTNQSRAEASWVDINANGLPSPGVSTAVTNNLTSVDLVASPAAGTTRCIMDIKMSNSDTASINPKFLLNKTGTLTNLWKGNVQVGGMCQYEDVGGWTSIGSKGQILGTSIYSGTLIHKIALTTSGAGTVSIPTGCNQIFLQMSGGGGGGGGCSASAGTAVSTGGGAGCYLEAWVNPAQTTSISYVVGAGGTAGNTSGGNGGVGVATTVTLNSIVYSATGGTAGAGSGLNSFGNNFKLITANNVGFVPTIGDIVTRSVPPRYAICLAQSTGVAGSGGNNVLIGGSGGDRNANNGALTPAVNTGAGGGGTLIQTVTTSSTLGTAGAVGWIYISFYS